MIKGINEKEISMLKKKKILLSFSLLLLFSFILTTCHSQKNEILIGAIYPLSGSNKAIGSEIVAGINLAVEIINNNYDLDIPLAANAGLSNKQNKNIRIIYKDYGDDPQKTVEMVDELVKKYKVTAIIGCYQSSATTLASERAETLGIPFINFESTSPVLTRRGLKYFFRTTPDDEIFARYFFQFLKDLSASYKFPKDIILFYENTVWGTGVANAELKNATKNNYKIIADIPYNPAKSSYQEEMNLIKNSPSSIILQSSYDKDAVLTMKSYKENNINPIAILAMNAGFVSPVFVKELGPDADYVISRDIWALDICEKKALAKRINDLFFLRNNFNLSGVSARAFTGMYALADALNKAKTLQPHDLIESISSLYIPPEYLIVPWDGIKFDETGQNILGKGIIVQIQNQKYYTIWPHNLAVRQPVFPFVKWNSRP